MYLKHEVFNLEGGGIGPNLWPSIKTLKSVYFYKGQHWRIQRGTRDTDPPPPLKNHKNIGFLSNTGPDLLKNHKATKPAFNF